MNPNFYELDIPIEEIFHKDKEINITNLLEPNGDAIKIETLYPIIKRTAESLNKIPHIQWLWNEMSLLEKGFYIVYRFRSFIENDVNIYKNNMYYRIDVNEIHGAFNMLIRMREDKFFSNILPEEIYTVFKDDAWSEKDEQMISYLMSEFIISQLEIYKKATGYICISGLDKASDIIQEAMKKDLKRIIKFPYQVIEVINE